MNTQEQPKLITANRLKAKARFESGHQVYIETTSSSQPRTMISKATHDAPFEVLVYGLKIANFLVKF